MNQSEQIARSFTIPQESENWDTSFDKKVTEFIVKFRSLGYYCDLMQSQRIAGGKSVLIKISKDGVYSEHFEIFYSGRDIIGRYIELKRG